MIEIDPEEALSESAVDVLINKANAQNKQILTNFSEYLKESGLAPKTIEKHVENIDFYINTYLLYYEIQSPHQGVDALDDFFTDFFPRKAMWSSVNSVKENITSLKKFYKFLNELKLVSNEELKEMNAMIKEEKENWMSLYQNEFDFALI